MSSPYPFQIHRTDTGIDDVRSYGDGDVVWHEPTGLVLIVVGDHADPWKIRPTLFAVSRATGGFRRACVPDGASTAAWWRTAYGGRYAASYDQAETMLTRDELATNDAGCSNLIAVSYQYSANGLLVDNPGDADMVTVFNGDGCCEVSVTVTKTGKWRLTASDYHCDAVPRSVWARHRYDNPREAIAEITARVGCVYVEVADWVTELPAAA
jgi:hypothetical protein